MPIVIAFVWLTRAAFVCGLLGSWSVASFVFTLDPAVVTDVINDGIIRDAFCIQVIDQLAAGFVKPLAHRVVFGDMF